MQSRPSNKASVASEADTTSSPSVHDSKSAPTTASSTTPPSRVNHFALERDLIHSLYNLMYDNLERGKINPHRSLNKKESSAIIFQEEFKKLILQDAPPLSLTNFIIFCRDFINSDNCQGSFETESPLNDLLTGALPEFEAIDKSNRLAYAADCMMTAYAIFPQTFANPNDGMNRIAGIYGGSITWTPSYLEEKDFVPDTHKRQFFTMDKAGTIISAECPIKESDTCKIVPFWGYTGFEHGDVSERLDENDIPVADSHAIRSNMGYVMLDTQDPSRPRLSIVFRGSRGGDTDLSLLNTAQGSLKKKKEADHQYESSNPDWLTDLDKGDRFSLSKNNRMKKFFEAISSVSEKEAKPASIHLHSGIDKAYRSCRPGIKKAITDLLESNDLTTFKGDIFVTGHSLGGGLATFALYDLFGGYKKEIGSLFNMLPDPKKGQTQRFSIQGMSFGAPAVGNSAFRTHFNTIADPINAKKLSLDAKKDSKKIEPANVLRSYFDQDPVTIQTKHSFGLKHINTRYVLDKECQQREKTYPSTVLRRKGENFDDTLLCSTAHEPAILWAVHQRILQHDISNFPFQKKIPLSEHSFTVPTMPMQYYSKKSTRVGELFELDPRSIPRDYMGKPLLFGVAKNYSSLKRGFGQTLTHERTNLTEMMAAKSDDILKAGGRFFSTEQKEITDAFKRFHDDIYDKLPNDAGMNKSSFFQWSYKVIFETKILIELLIRCDQSITNFKKVNPAIDITGLQQSYTKMKKLLENYSSYLFSIIEVSSAPLIPKPKKMDASSEKKMKPTIEAKKPSIIPGQHIQPKTTGKLVTGEALKHAKKVHAAKMETLSLFATTSTTGTTEALENEKIRIRNVKLFIRSAFKAEPIAISAPEATAEQPITFSHICRDLLNQYNTHRKIDLLIACTEVCEKHATALGYIEITNQLKKLVTQCRIYDFLSQIYTRLQEEELTEEQSKLVSKLGDAMKPGLASLRNLTEANDDILHIVNDIQDALPTEQTITSATGKTSSIPNQLFIDITTMLGEIQKQTPHLDPEGMLPTTRATSRKHGL